MTTREPGKEQSLVMTRHVGTGALATDAEAIEQAALSAQSTGTAPETMDTVVAGALDSETAQQLCGR
jgi:hypothetical protein